MSESADLLSVAEAARAIGVSERTVWRWVRAGQIESVKVGRRLFVRPPARRGRDLAEAALVYEAGEAVAAWPGGPELEPEPGPWPYTADKLAERRRILLEERRAAFDELARLAVPVPKGYVEELTRQVKDENRAWDALVRGEKAMKARARRRTRQ